MSLIWRLLRQHINGSQLLGFSLANLVGSLIVLLTIQLYCDLSPLFSQGESFMRSDYLILSKEVTTVGNLFGKSHTFTPQEIQEVKDQSFARRVGEFTTAQFEIYAALNLPDANQRISSDIFFESVPDHYIDLSSERWHYDAEKRVIPIIIPRNYLNLYNFGFSQSRGLPKLSEGAISMINLEITIRGAMELERFNGNIIGFSDRINTILVPQSFMDWANPKFAGHKPNPPARLILEVDNPANEAIATFFTQKRYTTEDDKLDAGKITHLLRLVIYGVLAIGLFISLLSLYILMLSIFLLLEKSSRKIQNLLLIGYSPAQVSRPYHTLTIAINALILSASLLLVALLRSYYLPAIESLLPSSDAATMTPTLLFGVLLSLLVSAVNCTVIWRRVARL